MADSNQKKTDANELPALGEISFNESGDIPGVTQLLTPSLVKGRKNQAEPSHAAEEAPHPNPEYDEEDALELAEVEAMELDEEEGSDFVSPAQSKESQLQDLGVKFELLFSGNGSLFTFQSFEESTPGSFDPWRKEFYSGMKIDLKLLSIQSDFQEFSGKSAPFQREVFGLSDSDFFTFFRNSVNRDTLSVLISSVSLASRKNDLESIYSAPQNLAPISEEEAPAPAVTPEVKKDYIPDDDDIKIEIA
jgi:hypothetical protein